MYRMYVDEVGNSDLKSSAEENHRYLSLTGVILSVDYVDSVVAPELEALKRRHFRAHVDEPLIFHRKELVNKKYPFDALRDPSRALAFDTDILDFLRRIEYVVVTATIDKQEHLSKYSAWHHHPYHYCQAILLERYAMWMNRRGFQGDVYGESRGTKEDRNLKTAFREVYISGTRFLPPKDIQRCLTNDDIKLKRKPDNIAGLQIADLIAHPSFKAMVAKRRGKTVPGEFGAKIVSILEELKYDRDTNGKIEGRGTKWLP